MISLDEDEKVAIFVDIENVLGYHLLLNQIYRNFISIFLFELLAALRRENVSYEQNLLYVFMKRKASMSNSWQLGCERIVQECGFQLFWSQGETPAEDVLTEHAQVLINSGILPSEILVISGDGDLIPAIDILRWEGQKRDVCVSSFAWKLNPFLRQVASGYAELSEIVPITTKTLLTLNALHSR